MRRILTGLTLLAVLVPASLHAQTNCATRDTVVQKLEANPSAMGIFGFSFLDENGDKVQGSEIGGVIPSFDSIASGNYPISRPLYFYIKGAHVGKIPGIQEYASEFTSKHITSGLFHVC